MKTCIVVVNVFNQSAQNLIGEINDFLSKNNYTSVIVEFDGANKSFPDIHFDFVISLGGDGTVLYISRQCIHTQKPIFPINFGEFGFIAGIQPEHWKDSLQAFLDKKLVPTSRSLLYVEVIRNDECVHREHALNEVVLTSSTAMKTIFLNVEVNSIPFGRFKADGIIMATSTGSTAYSLAAGGPIVDPSIDAILFNPVSPFSLSTRPLVLSNQTELTLEVLPSRSSNFLVSCDGQIHTDIQAGDIITVKQSTSKTLLVGCTAPVFYSALRSKLQWSGGPFD